VEKKEEEEEEEEKEEKEVLEKEEQKVNIDLKTSTKFQINPCTNS
jgi:hypothetical protein